MEEWGREQRKHGSGRGAPEAGKAHLHWHLIPMLGLAANTEPFDSVPALELLQKSSIPRAGSTGCGNMGVHHSSPLPRSPKGGHVRRGDPSLCYLPNSPLCIHRTEGQQHTQHTQHTR